VEKIMSKDGRCVTNQVADGFAVSRGSDGHWMDFKFGSRRIALNVENMLSVREIGRTEIIGWIDERLLLACKTCNGHGDVSAVETTAMVPCEDCVGTGIASEDPGYDCPIHGHISGDVSLESPSEN
jgi:hypothetical protein